MDGKLHLWGEAASSYTAGAERSPQGAPCAETVPHEELRACVGDLWDSLLASDAIPDQLTLRLPHAGGSLLASWTGSRPNPESFEPAAISLVARTVSTLAFAPADAVDLLAGVPTMIHPDVRIAASSRFWSRAALLVLDLLAKQHFLPAIREAGGNRFAGYWRAVIDDRFTRERIQKLIDAMPPVCRESLDGRSVEAAALIDDFLLQTVDALTRRALEGDELAHPVRDRPDETWSPEMRWLRSLVHADPILYGDPDTARRVYGTVREWLSKLEPPAPQRAYRLCFQLHPPEFGKRTRPRGGTTPWRLTLHVQSMQQPSVVLDVASLLREPQKDPMILQRSLAASPEDIRADLAGAARVFSPLAGCTEPGGPLECSLRLDEAYRFLRDAAPVLEQEGFGVFLPRWWRQDGPRLRLRMGVQPVDASSSAEPSNLPLQSLVAFDWRIALGDDELTPEEITRLAGAKEPLVRIRGRWTEVHGKDVQTAVDFLQRNREERATLLEALRRYYLADEEQTGLPVTDLRASGWIDRLLNSTDIQDEFAQVEKPPAFHGDLRPYQQRGLAWLSFLSRHGLGACLADDMGLGKTIQMIALWLHERQAGKCPGPTLLVVPMSLVGNWQRELQRFAPSLRVMVHHGLERLTGQDFIRETAGHDVVISTYGLTHRDYDHLAGVVWHRIALDEAQNIKNPAAKQSVALRSLQCVQRVALTGTPVENRLSELWSILDFLNPGYLGNAHDFRHRFALPIERYHDDNRAQRLRHLIRPFILRRRKDDPSIQLDLPEKMEMKVYCNLTREQAALYEAIVREMLSQIELAGGIQRRGLILATLVKLKQVCNHPTHFLSDGSDLPHRSGKCDRIVEMLEEVLAEGHRALVFTQFREMGGLLEKLLEDSLGCSVLFLHGGTSQKNREMMIDQFQNPSGESPVFILSLKAGGFGLNLTAANHVFHFDRWWNPAVEDQASSRAHRIGQDKAVQIHKFVCVGTLEERIDTLIEHKRNIAENIVGSGEEWLTELSTEALRDLFTLSREAVSEE